MAEDTSASFIPKRNPAKKIKRAVTRRVYLFTFFSYVLLFIALILSAVLFGYKLVLENQVVDNIEELNTAIASFSVEDMQSVVELDARLRLAEERVANHLSVSAFLTLIEASTVQSVQFQDMNVSRESDDLVVVTASIVTSDFDSALFQRQVYQESEQLSGVTLEDISFSVDGSAVQGAGGGASWYINPGENIPRNTATDAANNDDTDPVISMTAIFRINAEDIPFVPPQTVINSQPAAAPVTESDDTTLPNAASAEPDSEADGDAVRVEQFNPSDV